MFLTLQLSKILGLFSWSPSFALWEAANIHRRSSGPAWLHQDHVKFVDSGTTRLSHCPTRNAANIVNLHSIVLYN